MGKLKMTNEQKEAAVKEAAENIAQDVSETVASDERPKKKAHRTTKKASKRTPAQEAADAKADPLKGATIDPDTNYPKILHLIVTVGSDDTRSMDDFVSQVRETLMDEVNAKHVTALLKQYAIEGQHINSHHYDAAIAAVEKDDDADA